MKRCLLLLALLPSLASHAASFDCAKAQSQDEKAICRHPEISRLDEEMAQAYAQTLKGNNASGVKAAQRQWLQERRGCGSSVPCLKSLYTLRIAELKGAGVRWSPRDWQNAKGTWMADYSTELNKQQLDIQSVSEKGFEFSLDSQNGAHTGSISGYARFTPDGVLFKNTYPENTEYDNGDCQLRFIPLGPDRMKVERDDCLYYGGMGAPFGGLFLKSAHEKEASLLGSGVFDSPEEDQAFRALTGKAYKAFAYRLLHPSLDQKDLDGLGAKVATGFMRGNAPDGAIVMKSRDGRFYAAFLDGGKLHYFSNDSHYAKRLPKTISSWARGTEGL